MFEMKFYRSLVFAFIVTALILSANAFEFGFFAPRKPNSVISLRDRVTMKKLSSRAWSEPLHYSDPIVAQIALRRANEIMKAALPDNSCVQAFWLNNGDVAPEPFLDLNSNQSLIPASTNKLITAALVFSQLDPESTLDTNILAEKKSSTLTKAYITTSGDPSFVSSKTPTSRRPSYLSPINTHTFDAFADATYEAGVRSISSLIIDDSWFALSNVEEGWANDKSQVGLISGFNIDEGFNGSSLASDPSETAASNLKMVFERKGISIGSISFGPKPEKLNYEENFIAGTSSASVKDLVSDMLKTSNNVYAEQLLVAAIHDSKGRVDKQIRSEFVTERLNKLGINTAGYTFENGSGYSYDARSTCALENQIVINTKEKSSLDLTELSSVAGKDGTLAQRFTNLGESLTAKTGTLNNVTALTGTLGEQIVFSFISNSTFTEQGGREYQARVISILQNYPFIESLEFRSGMFATNRQ